MIEHELILLGLLREKPKHGYEIKKKIKELFYLFADVDFKSIYYPLKVLEKQGLVIKRIAKFGRRPPRIVYALTPKGQRRFNQLLSASLLDFKRPQFTLDLSLYFLHYMKPAVAKRRLHARLMIINKISRGLSEMIRPLRHRDPASLVQILEHNRKMIEAESEFIQQLTNTLQR